MVDFWIMSRKSKFVIMNDPYFASSKPQSSSIVKWSASDGDVIKLPVGDDVYDRDTSMCIRIKTSVTIARTTLM